MMESPHANPCIDLIDLTDMTTYFSSSDTIHDRPVRNPTDDAVRTCQVGIARGIAFAVHHSQRDADGPRVARLARMAETVRRLGTYHEAAVWLHGVLTCSRMKPQDLLDAGMSDTVVEAVKFLTADDDEMGRNYAHMGRNYAHFVERIISDHEGRGHTVSQEIAATIVVLDLLEYLGSGGPDSRSLYANSVRLLIETFPKTIINVLRCGAYDRLRVTAPSCPSQPS